MLLLVWPLSLRIIRNKKKNILKENTKRKKKNNSRTKETFYHSNNDNKPNLGVWSVKKEFFILNFKRI